MSYLAQLCYQQVLEEKRTADQVPEPLREAVLALGKEANGTERNLSKIQLLFVHFLTRINDINIL